MEEESTSEANEFFIPDFAGYADINMARCVSAQCLLTDFQHIEIADLDPNDRECEICHEEFSVSEDLMLSHPPVRTPCGHIFGDNCLMMWLETMYVWSSTDPDPDGDVTNTGTQMSNTSCPKCRHNLIYSLTKVRVEELAHLILFWDQAYAFAGVTRTEHEKNCRDPIVRYIKYFCATHERKTLHKNLSFKLDRKAQHQLWRFANFLKTQTLSSELENQRVRLERIARKDLSKCLKYRDDEYEYVFDINRDDDEREEFNGNPMEKAILGPDYDELTQPDEQQLEPFCFLGSI
ncbi:hypothetical protein MMC07_006060 [Pseudocyphellaria aurata]|nr:hypothetical protein [Pseudocyphellaria aurata]